MSLDGQRLILANGTLVLRSVKAEDSGYYTCTATNTLGFDTIIVNLLVQGRKMATMAAEFEYLSGSFIESTHCDCTPLTGLLFLVKMRNTVYFLH